jgi:putative ABC transport system permease protein
MYAYYFKLALRSFGRNKVLTALMVVAIALGIGACMTTLTVFHILSGDPLPGRSEHLFMVQLDPTTKQGYRPGEEPPEQVTRYDAETLLREKHADRQAMMTGGSVPVQPERADLAAFYTDSRYTSADFFPMFGVEFRYGQGWNSSDDDNHARVAVISQKLSEKLFGATNSVGQRIRIAQADFRVVGVVGKWSPALRFYDLNTTRGFGGEESVMVPFTTSRDLTLDRNGSMDCWSNTSSGDGTALVAPCVWIQYWVELGSAARVADYRQYLGNYSDRQRAAGRYERPTNIRLRSVMQWLDYKNIVPSDVRLQVSLAFGFLLVCLVNTVGLLFAKFLRRSGELGVRRALGASRKSIFLQCLVEAGTVGLAGGVLGFGFALLGLWGVRHQPTDYAELVRLDPVMLALTFGLALLASLAAGAFPAWRAMQVTPAIQLKTL